MKPKLFLIVFISTILGFLHSNYPVFAQKTVVGKIYTLSHTKNKVPIPYSIVSYREYKTLSDTNGYFNFQLPDTTNYIIVSAVGYASDSIPINNKNFLEIVLKPNLELQTITYTKEQDKKYMNRADVRGVEVISEKEIKRAACCNLSESFETNASVDVNYSDAITGAKQIRMLGLEGVYMQVLKENIPLQRGLSQLFGISLTPGFWLNSIQVSKGTGSVVNGYESMSGQLNLAYQKPPDADALAFNLYGDLMGRGEINILHNREINDKLSTAVQFHTNATETTNNRNGDNFLDVPKQRQISLRNYWEYNNGTIETQSGAEIIYQKRIGGEVSFKESDNPKTSPFFGSINEVKRLEAFTKIGFLMPNSPRKNQSLGTQFSFTRHEISGMYGRKSYLGLQNSGYANIIYQDELFSDKHIIKAGSSFQYDGFNEQINVVTLDTTQKRDEIIPGVFAEYNFNFNKKFILQLGYRYDYHNLFKHTHTPRVHIKIDPDAKSSIRLSAGKGYRTPNVWIENQTIWLSNRVIRVVNPITREESMNYGISYQRTEIFKKNKTGIIADYYYSNFQSQMVTNWDYSSHELIIAPLNGLSYAHSAQLEAFSEWGKTFSLRGAYKRYEVKTSYNNQLLLRPMVPKYRILLTAQYATKYEKWVIDATAQYFGAQRMPTNLDYMPLVNNGYTVAYPIFHIQVTKNFKNFSLYVGSENLLNYKQDNPIMGYNDPLHNKHFDATMIWAPIEGRRVYAGFRYTIK